MNAKRSGWFAGGILLALERAAFRSTECMLMTSL
jgi:hypothetical protein